MDMFNNSQMLSVSPKNTGGGGGGGTSDYNELSGKPSVNNVVLEGDKTLDELGIQKKGNYVSSEDIAKHNTSGVSHKDIRDSIPTKTSQLTNDSGFITDINAHNHDDLYYSKKEVDDKINTSLLPSIAITDTFVSDSEDGMLGLTTAEKGDICIRTDVNKTFILAEDGYDKIDNWKELSTPSDGVGSVNGKTGEVTLTTSDINEGTNLYYTEDRADANFVKHSSTELADSGELLRVTDVLTLNGGNA